MQGAEGLFLMTAEVAARRPREPTLPRFRFRYWMARNVDGLWATIGKHADDSKRLEARFFRKPALLTTLGTECWRCCIANAAARSCYAATRRRFRGRRRGAGHRHATTPVRAHGIGS